jgi:predicted N-acetyltransferase YhbS
MIQFYKERKVPFMIWIGPSSQPQNLEEEMEKAGIIDTEYTTESGGMWMDIQDLHALQLRHDALIEKTGIKIIPIETQKHIEDAGEVMKGVFGIPEELQEMQRELMEDFTKTPHNERDYIGYIAYLNGIPVSLSSAYLGGGVAGIYNVGTLKKYQKQGIGSAVILATLIGARQRGYEISIISGTEEGFIVYKKLGFIPLPCMKQYVWFPKALQRFLVRRYYKKQRKKHNYIPRKL